MWLAAGPEPSGAEGKALGKRMGPPVVGLLADAAGDTKGASLDKSCSPVEVFCSAVPLDKLAVTLLLE